MKKPVAQLRECLPANIIALENLRINAVLLPLVEINGVTEVLFEVRSKQLKWQPGEICFPGGQVEGPDEMANPVNTAIRETTEELGLQRGDIEILTPMGFMFAPMGTVNYAYVGRLIAPERIKPNREEVESVFTVPLSFLTANRPQASKMDVATRLNEDFPLHRVPEVYRSGWYKRWSYLTYFYEYGEHFIWGMTAILLHHFLEHNNTTEY
ncbi:MAG: CoA pyrophosphatase [Firmicutes bacterium]|nr:CoA pyrophosphatase [Bacillota bacterium]